MKSTLGLVATLLTLSLFPAASLGADRPDAAALSELAADPWAAEFRDLMQRHRQARTRRLELLELARQASGERRSIFEEQAAQRQREAQAAFGALAENLSRQQAAGRDVSDAVALVNEELVGAWPSFRAQLEVLEAEGRRLVDSLEAASGEERLALEKQRGAQARQLASEYRLLVDVILALETIGIDVSAQRAFATERIGFLGEYLSSAVRLTTVRLGQLRARISDNPDDKELVLALEVVNAQLDREVRSLSLAAELLEDLGVETASYRQMIFEATGEVTTDVLDRKVALGLLETWRARAAEALLADGSRWALKALVFVLILAAFRIAASVVRRLVQRSVSSDRVRVSQLLRDTLVSWSSRAVMVVGVLVALGQLGVAIGPLLAGLGIAGFVLGFALQDSLSNFAAGTMILMYRPYDVGDLIEAAGVRGRVSAMNLVSTTVLTIDNRTLIVPNSKIWGDVILNETAQTIRRIDLVFGVSYDTDVDRADAVFRDVLAKHDKVLDQPEPIVEVHNLSDSSVDFAVRPWVRTDDYWPVFWSLKREVKKRLDAAGIRIPFPQRDVHVRVVKDTSD